MNQPTIAVFGEALVDDFITEGALALTPRDELDRRVRVANRMLQSISRRYRRTWFRCPPARPT